MGKKRSTKATASIQPYVGPELPETPEQREVDQDQTTVSPAQEAALGPSETAAESAKTPNLYDVYEPVARRFFDLQFRPAEITTGSPAQQAVASPSETAAENAKAQKRLRMQAAFGNPMAAMALAMLAVQDNLISNAFQKIENANQPCLELPSPPEQREVDQDQIKGSPAQEAVARPSEPETIQASPKARRRSKKRNSTRNKLILGYAEKGNDIKKITTMMNTIHGEDMGYDAVQKVILRARPTDKNEDK